MKKILAFVLVFVFALGMETTAFASDFITFPDDFGELESPGINQSENYYLDLADQSIIDKSGAELRNSLVNSMFNVSKFLVEATCTLYYYISTLDFSEWFEPLIEPMQRNFKEKLFDTLFELLFVFACLGMATFMFKRNYPEIISRITSIVLLYVAASLLVTNSLPFYKAINQINESASNAIVEATSTTNTSYNYSLKTVETLWKTLIHEPWKILEFHKYTPDNDLETQLLSGALPIDSEERQETIDEINSKAKKDKDSYIPFDKNVVAVRLAYLLIYGIIVLVKCVIYFLIAIIQCLLKLATLILLMMGILILALAIVPWFGGMKLVGRWGLQLLKVQLIIWLFSFIIGVLTMLDNMIYLNAINSGILISLALQIALTLGVVLNWKHIFGFILHLPDKIVTKNSADLTNVRAGNVQAALSSTGSVIHDKAVAIGSGIYRGSELTINKLREIGTYFSNDIESDEYNNIIPSERDRPTLSDYKTDDNININTPDNEALREIERPNLLKPLSLGNGLQDNINNNTVPLLTANQSQNIEPNALTAEKDKDARTMPTDRPTLSGVSAPAAVPLQDNTKNNAIPTLTNYKSQDIESNALTTEKDKDARTMPTDRPTLSGVSASVAAPPQDNTKNNATLILTNYKSQDTEPNALTSERDKPARTMPTRRPTLTSASASSAPTSPQERPMLNNVPVASRPAADPTVMAAANSSYTADHDNTQHRPRLKEQPQDILSPKTMPKKQKPNVSNLHEKQKATPTPTVTDGNFKFDLSNFEPPESTTSTKNKRQRPNLKED